MRTKAIDMTKGPIIRSLILYMLPLIGGSIFQQLYNTADFLFVGNLLGKTAAAAVGASSTLIFCVVGLFTGISAGNSVVISQFRGAGDKEHTDQALHSAMTFGLVAGLLLMVIAVALAPWGLRLMKTPENVYPLARVYMQIYFLSMPATVLYNMASGALNAIGDSVTPFRVLVFCGFLNVALDALFVRVIPLGVAGVAIATLLCQTVSMAILLGILLKGREGLKLQIHNLGIDRDILERILRIGLPAGFQTIVIAFSNAMVQYFINGYGELEVAAFATYFKVENLIYLPILAVGSAASTFAGQNTGAKNYRRIRKGTLLLAFMGASITVMIAILLLLTSHTVFGLFINDREVVGLTIIIAGVTFPFYFIYPVMEACGGALRGMGYAICSMIITISCMCMARVSILAFLSTVFHSIEAVASVYPITWALAAISFAVLFSFVINGKMKKEEDLL